MINQITSERQNRLDLRREHHKKFQWTYYSLIAIGFWIMISPGHFGFGGSLADCNHFTGALVVTFSIISMSEIVRTGRFLNILFALWIIASIWLFDNSGGIIMWSHLCAGVFLTGLSFRKGIMKDQYGGFNRYIK